jgi:hypothetical protein
MAADLCWTLRYGRPLACLLFGSAIWSCAARDIYIYIFKGNRMDRILIFVDESNVTGAVQESVSGSPAKPYREEQQNVRTGFHR